MKKGDRVVIVGPLDTRWFNYVGELEDCVGKEGVVEGDGKDGVNVVFDNYEDWWFEAANVKLANSAALSRTQKILAQIEELIKELKEI